MNTQEYIASGIVEAYVLGLAAPEEMREFEQMCAQYREVLDAREAFELALEKQAGENAVTPPASLKEKIHAAIVTPARVIEMETSPAVRNSWLKYVAAAAIVLLIGSAITNMLLYKKNTQLRNDATVAQLQADSASAELAGMENEMAKIRPNPNMRIAAMKGMEASPASFATVYWDTTSHDVYLLVNNLPAPPSDKQYQLWAIFNGQPVDLGVFEYKKEKLLVQAKNTQGAQAFAITLEERGGSPTPKGAMYVMGKL